MCVCMYVCIFDTSTLKLHAAASTVKFGKQTLACIVRTNRASVLRTEHRCTTITKGLGNVHCIVCTTTKCCQESLSQPSVQCWGVLFEGSRRPASSKVNTNGCLYRNILGHLPLQKILLDAWGIENQQRRRFGRLRTPQALSKMKKVESRQAQQEFQNWSTPNWHWWFRLRWGRMLSQCNATYAIQVNNCFKLETHKRITHTQLQELTKAQGFLPPRVLSRS